MSSQHLLHHELDEPLPADHDGAREQHRESAISEENGRAVTLAYVCRDGRRLRRPPPPRAPAAPSPRPCAGARGARTSCPTSRFSPDPRIRPVRRRRARPRSGDSSGQIPIRRGRLAPKRRSAPGCSRPRQSRARSAGTDRSRRRDRSHDTVRFDFDEREPWHIVTFVTVKRRKALPEQRGSCVGKRGKNGERAANRRANRSD